MADTSTAHLALVKPEVGASRDSWGGKVNGDLDSLDAIFAPLGTGTGVGLHIGTAKKLVIDGTIEGAGYLPAGTITYAKIQNISVTDRLLGRMTAGAGPIEEIPCTAAGRAILDDVDAAAQRTTLNAASLGPNSFTGDQTLASTVATPAEGPLLVLDRNSPDPAIDDIVGAVHFKGRNIPLANVVYAKLNATIKAVAAAAETGILNIETMVAGTLAPRFFYGNGMAAQGLADMGAGTLNVIEYYKNGQALGFMPRGHIDGFTLSSAASDVTIGKGQATAVEGDALMARTAVITKQLAAVWAVGTGAGGLDTGAKANNTWYHVWVIMRPDTGIVDALLSISATAPTMPANYTKKRRVGSVKTGAAPGDIVGFQQLGDDFEWDEPVIDIDDAAPGSIAATRTLSVPLGVRVFARITPCQRIGSIHTATNFSSLNVTDQDVQSVAGTALTLPATVGPAASENQWQFAGEMYVRTNTSRQIRSRTNSADRIGIICRGWRDPRGKDAA